jgi:signal transduction histidine kinase
MSSFAYTLAGLTAIVGVLMGVLIFALLRFSAAARDSKRHLRESGAETAFLAAALQDAVGKLKAQERAMSVRAEASEKLSGEIVASLTAGLLVVDSRGAVKILNPAGRHLLGWKGDDVPAHYHQLLGGAKPLADAIDECCATGEPIVRRAVQLEQPGRGVVHVGVTVSPLARADGHGAICLFSDLTAIMELEEQLRLKEALAQLGELTAGLAHEFRNGLATIHGYARLLDPKALPSQYGPYVEGIRQETDALGQVVTRFLSFARPEHMQLARVPLEPVVRRACDEIAHEFRDAQIDVGGEFGTIDGDEVLLKQVFSNLVRNAVEACTGANIRAEVRVTGSVVAGTCRVNVEDNGPGIEPSIRDRIFRPFVSTRATGTGLGLAIVQKIVVLHNGRVAVGTSPSGGAAFQITFPFARR